MSYRVVRLGAASVDVAAAIVGEYFRDALVAPDRLASMLVDERNIVLAALRGSSEVAGYLVAYEFPSLWGETLVYLYDIEVRASERRQGIGRALVALLHEICRADGVDEIWVGSSLTNAPACALWEATGATRVSDQYVEFTYRLRDTPAPSPDR